MVASFFSALPIKQMIPESLQAYRQYSLAVRQKEDPQDLLASVDGLQLLSRQISMMRPTWVGHVSNQLGYWVVGRYIVSWMCPNKNEAGKGLSSWGYCIQKIDAAMAFGTKMVAPFLRVATVVASITLVYFGFWFRGGLGATAWFLQELKRRKHLPVFLDEHLQKIEVVGDLFGAISPGSWVLRITNVSRCFNVLSQSAVCKNFLQHRYPWLQNPFLGRHVHSPWNSSQYQSSKDALDLSRWQVNPTHIHAGEVGQLWPVDGECRDLGRVIKKFEKWMKEFPESLRAGFETIKEMTTLQNTDRDCPENREEFLLFLKNLLHTKHVSLQKLSPPQRLKCLEIFLQNIDRVTKKPVRTWMAALSGIVRPHSTNIAWEVHASLSRFREKCLDRAVAKYEKEMAEDLPQSGLDGIKNVFVIQRAPLHVAMRHLFRTRLGEMISKMSRPSQMRMFFTKHILDSIEMGQEKPSVLYELLNDAFCNVVYLENSGGYSVVMATPIRDNNWKEISNANNTVNYVYQNIKKKQIAAKAVKQWEKDFCHRVGLTRGEFNSLYKEMGSNSCKMGKKLVRHLNHQGVILLLADLGVLKYKQVVSESN